MEQRRLGAVDSIQAATVVSSTAAVFSAAAAFGAWRAGAKAGRAAETLTSIEAKRRWQELTPEFSTQLRRINVGGPVVKLVLELDGPLALQQLDSLTVRIRDDRPGRSEEVLAGGPTAEQISAQVWGPFQFTPGVGPGPRSGRGGADANGRAVDVVAMPLLVGEGLPFQLEPTKPPAWFEANETDANKRDARWRTFVGFDLRLTVTARTEGLDPWVIPMVLPTSGKDF